MLEHLHRRILYGRQIRTSAARLLDLHGAGATAVADSAAADRGLSEGERSYWAAVARRTARLSTCAPPPGAIEPEARAAPAPARGRAAGAGVRAAAAREPARG